MNFSLEQCAATIALLTLFLTSFPSDAILHQRNTYISAQTSFLQCLNNTRFPSNLIFTPSSKNYSTVFFSTVQNPRTLTNPHKPLLIVTPTHESHVQSIVYCSKSLNNPIRVRSGGHDFEGLSYTSLITPLFIILDLQKFAAIEIDASVSTAWVQSGATLGELYYAIARKSQVVAFPAGVCPTVGIGGHFSGGGLGTIGRAHGLSIDNIIDAQIVNANGDVLDRKSMGEDLFWALRGGGGASFGVILSYRIKLVQVPPKVTIFDVYKTLLVEDASTLISRFQDIGYKLDRRTYINANLNWAKGDNADFRVQVTFSALFLGEKGELISLMKHNFSELELKENDCFEMSWIESVMHFAGYQSSMPMSTLLDRRPWFNGSSSFKGKIDFVTRPIGEEGWNNIFGWLRKEDAQPLLQFQLNGGRISEISETETPFPHRREDLYSILYFTQWTRGGREETQKHLDMMRRFHEFMTPYVSRNPRATYLNNRDLDLGMNEEGNTSYAKAAIWGEKYFKGNFKKLAQVKSEVDPTNLFRNEQSIPLLY